jgi:hypothetical protein
MFDRSPFQQLHLRNWWSHFFFLHLQSIKNGFSSQTSLVKSFSKKQCLVVLHKKSEKAEVKHLQVASDKQTLNCAQEFLIYSPGHLG